MAEAIISEIQNLHVVVEEGTVLDQYRFWNFKPTYRLRDVRYMGINNLHEYEVCFNDSDENYNFLVNNDKTNRFNQFINKEVLSELCIINMVYGFSGDRIFIARSNSYYNQTFSLKFYVGHWKFSDMNRNGDDIIHPLDSIHDDSMVEMDYTKFVLTDISYFSDDGGMYLPSTSLYTYSFKDNMFKICKYDITPNVVECMEF